MAAVSDFEHLFLASRLISLKAAELYDEHFDSLKTGSSTIDVNGLRTCSMVMTITAVGLMGTFEAMLQQRTGWTDTYGELNKALRGGGRADLADRMNDVRLAINVLKHGEGSSYEKLLFRRGLLPFPIKGRGEAFFNEGDVSEVGGLVDTRGGFLDGCTELLNEINAFLGVA